MSFNKLTVSLKIIAPTEGIEPSTYGLEVHRAIHCAMRAYMFDLFLIQ